MNVWLLKRRISVVVHSIYSPHGIWKKFIVLKLLLWWLIFLTIRDQVFQGKWCNEKQCWLVYRSRIGNMGMSVVYVFNFSSFLFSYSFFLLDAHKQIEVRVLYIEYHLDHISHRQLTRWNPELGSRNIHWLPSRVRKSRVSLVIWNPLYVFLPMFSELICSLR